MNKWWLLVPGVLLAWYFYTRSKFSFNLIGIKLKPKPVILMQIYNPTNEKDTINSIVADIYYKNNRLGIITQFQPIKINANTRTNVELPISADAFGFAYLLTDIAKTGKEVIKNSVVEVKGTINVSGLPVKFTQTFNLS